MTPAEHAVREALLHVERHPHSPLPSDFARALAERATEWAVEFEEFANAREARAEIVRLAERATELETERERMEMAILTEVRRGNAAETELYDAAELLRLERERAERAEAALREIVEDADKTEASLDQHSGQGKMAALSALARRIADIARAALGETAPATDDQINNSFDAYR